MSVEELKRIVDSATPSERVFLTSYAAAKLRSEDAEHAHQVDAAHRRIDAGQHVTLSDARRLCDELDRAGL